MSNRPLISAGRTGRRIAILGAILSLGALIVGQVLASPPSALNKLRRQIDVMSRIVDQVLLDSPNFLVHSGANVTGFYLPDYGAIFAFDASLTDDSFGSALSWLPGGVDIRNEDGNRTIVIKKRHISKDGEGKAEEREEIQRRGATEKKGDGKDDPARLYDLGKEELVQMVLDYAGTLSALPPGESVAVIANVRNDRLWKEKKRQQLQLRVEGDDLKAFASDRLSERELRARITIEEL